jgi:hypothetical protein
MQPVQGLVAPRRSSQPFFWFLLRQVHQEEKSRQTVEKADCEAKNDNDCIHNVCADKNDSSAELKGEVR